MAERGEELRSAGTSLLRRVIGEISQADPPQVLGQRFSPNELGDWTPLRLRTLLGNRSFWVEYSRTGTYVPQPAVNGGRYFRKLMTAADALDRIVFEHHYAFAHYISIDVTSDWPELASVLPIIEGPAGAPMSRVLFVGNGLSGTHAHYDLPDNAVLVLTGQKQFTLFAPHRTMELRPHAAEHRCSNFSSLSDDEIETLATREGGLKVTVGPGEIIYIPSCWWHRVSNRGFTVSLTNLWPATEAQKRHWSYQRFAESTARYEQSAEAN